MILCGDIGGTKALMGLAEGMRIAGLRRFDCANYDSFDALLSDYLSDTGIRKSDIEGGCLAVAGPVEDNGRRARLTNLPWVVDIDALALPRVRLANDFAAAAMGTTAAASDHLTTLRPGEPLAQGPRLVVGAGTGLGMAVLVPDGPAFRVLPGEGGHVGFSPQDEIQARIHAALLAEHGRVTWERVVSGPGLAAIHRTLAGEALDPSGIAEQALADPASSAGRSLDAFLKAYGAFAGDMALTVLARGGVYLAGGIAAKILPALRDGPFLAAFDDKAEHARLATRMPVHVVTDPELGLKGAALLGRQ